MPSHRDAPERGQSLGRAGTLGHVGVLGTGDWCRVHLAALEASEHVERVTLVGRNREAAGRLADEFPIVSDTTTELDQLLDDASVSVVHVVLPHDQHAGRTIAALKAGKHVICEKPAATSLADFDAAVATAKTHNRRLLVVMNQLYNPIVWQVRALVDGGTIGRPFLSVENAFSDASKNYRRCDTWRCTVEQAGGGVLIDGGYHMVYRHLYALAGVGVPCWVTAETAQLAVSEDGTLVKEKGEDFVSATVGYEEGMRIAWTHGWTLAGQVARARQCFLAGTEGSLELTDQAETPLVLRRPDDRVEGPVQPIEVPPGPRTGRETTHTCLLDYLDCLATDRQPGRVSLSLARRTLATVLAVYESSREGRRIEIDS